MYHASMVVACSVDEFSLKPLKPCGTQIIARHDNMAVTCFQYSVNYRGHGRVHRDVNVEVSLYTPPDYYFIVICRMLYILWFVTAYHVPACDHVALGTYRCDMALLLQVYHGDCKDGGRIGLDWIGRS